MKKAIGVGLLVGGIVMLVYGFQSRDSLESKVNQVFRGSPSSKTMWLTVGGAFAAVAGLVIVLGKSK